MRYPGGNFVSGYHWEDGIGPRNQRPRRRELAWQTIESNQFGVDEFIHFCRAIDTEPMLAVNLGTGTIQDAANLVEYCNAPPGSQYADMRAANGRADAHAVKYWCLGNEMDGPWQIGHLNAVDYAKKAREAPSSCACKTTRSSSCFAARQARKCQATRIGTAFGLEHCWDLVAISLNALLRQQPRRTIRRVTCL